ncbi:ammonia-forming cytochrome c nitrite reductase subunit c552 [Pseudohalioglobus sediminis]|uniref:Ammonia-forming cytochrome c nitrite reductase subunit c552 n=1 Tax=Pseudohalioglobus sediminis TaxID=2606449 RepID=A0A5B0WTK2_9GAMM|nr:tetratricopeptide repeat protein [Pseudohalioglobus sediminis]KAA1190410.1 ammonia-forming cytochrome c nitrite reductase subunit c552 [Pseudohalioglobus sediminis]
MLFRFLALALILLSSPGYTSESQFTGSASCQTCHASEYANWQGSHHDLAMQLPTAETVLGDFNDASFTYNGVTSRFYRNGEKFMVRTDGEDGKLTDFEVAYVFGVYPLQQYLLPLSRGRLQALTIAWDARPREQGGQRWYHLFPDEPIDFADPLHWTGPYHNWNTRCAECHSTDLQKNYERSTRSFDTSYKEIDVSCEACHGPGSKHLELAASDQLGDVHGGGFATDLAQRGEWFFPEGADIARRSETLESREQIDNCGRCHSRRGTLGDYHYGADLLDTHRLSVLHSPLYHHDGQILDEVYVYGSFVQSKMHQAGVVCSNCHEPHSAELRASGNAICAQCHKPATYDTPEHHFHPADSAGASCADCHMPETTYMGVDPRRDHSMRIPRPDLSVVMGVPNACNQCHSDRDAQWAVDALREKGVVYRDTGSHFSRAFARLAQGDTRALPTLAQLANDATAPPIWRATAMEALGQVGGREATQTMAALLYDDDSIIRTSTVRALDFISLQQRYQLLMPLVDDDILAVRMEVASALAGVPLDQVPAADAERLRGLFQEYAQVMEQHADMPSALMQLGLFRANRGDLPAAEADYREALALNPQLVAGYLNLADLLRAQGRDDDARQLLLTSLEVAPENGNTLHALGLLETRSDQPDKALEYLRRAAELETQGVRHRFVYAIALHDLGKPREAVAELGKLNRAYPNDEQVLLALVNYNTELGEQARARQWAQQLVRLAPRNPNYQQLLQKLSTAN